MHPSDEQLVSAYLDHNDERAFSLLVSRHQERIFGYLLGMVRDRSVANDLFQETFLRVIRAMQNQRGSYAQQDRWLAWVMRIARNAALDYLRSRKKWQDVPDLGDDDAPSFWERLPADGIAADGVLAEPTSTAREMVVRLGVEWGEVFDTSMEEYASLAIDRCVAGAYGESVQPTHDGIRCSPADVSVLAAGPARYVGTCASVELVVVAVIGPCEVEAVYDEVQHSTIEEFRGAPSIFDGNAFGVGCVFEGLGDQQPTPGTRMSATVRVLAGRPEVIWGQQMRPSGTFEVVSFEIHR